MGWTQSLKEQHEADLGIKALGDVRFDRARVVNALSDGVQDMCCGQELSTSVEDRLADVEH